MMDKKKKPPKITKNPTDNQKLNTSHTWEVTVIIVISH